MIFGHEKLITSISKITKEKSGIVENKKRTNLREKISRLFTTRILILTGNSESRFYENLTEIFYY